MVIGNSVDLIARLGLDPSGFVRGSRQVESATGRMQRQTNQVNTAGTRLSGTLRNLAGGVAIGAAATAVFNFGKDAVNSFNNLNESVNASNKIFGEASDTILSFGESAATSVGLANSEFNQLAAQTGAIFTGMGFDAQFAADETIKLTQRSSDLASIFNTDVNQAVAAVGSLMRGETEPARQFGVSIDAAAVSARALELGLADSTGEIDKQAKAIATLDLFYEQTASSAGDFADTSDDATNKARIQAARFEDFKAILGETLAPLQDFSLSLAEDLIPALETSVEGVEDFIDGVEAVVGPLVGFVQGLRDLDSGLSSVTDEEVSGAAATQQLADAYQSAVDGLQAVIDRTEEFVGLAPERSLEKTDNALRKIVGTGGDAAAAVQDFKDEVAPAGEAADEAAAPTQSFALFLRDVANFALDAAAAVLGYNSALKESANPVFAASQAIGRLNDAQADLIEVQEDSDSSARDVAEAQLAVAEALIEAQLALDSLDAAGPSEAIAALSEIMGISKQEAEDLLVQLGLLDGKQVVTFVTTEFTTRGSLPNLPPGQQPGGLIDRIGGRALGGPVTANTPFMVGERGPELFVPAVNGNIVPNNQLGQGSEVHVTINNPTAQNVEDDTRRGLQYAALLGMV